ncbi:DUF4097 domain-containing protein [Planctomycetota bacterium]
MRTNRLITISLISLLALLTTVAGCNINIGGWGPREKFERTVQLSAALQAGSAFAAKTHNGSITINGSDVSDCNLTATIIARANSEEDAQRLAEQTKIKLQSSGKTLTARITKPLLITNQSIGVSFNVTLPNSTDLELNTHNGAVKIANITGNTKATTHNGKINASQISGRTELKTHNGSISCGQISGNTKLQTHNGGINAVYCESAPSVCDVSLETHNGSISFKAPPNFSAKVQTSTHNGSIKTDLPITVIGKLSKTSLSGTIGSGQGKLHLKTHNGSIKIK